MLKNSCNDKVASDGERLLEAQIYSTVQVCDPEFRRCAPRRGRRDNAYRIHSPRLINKFKTIWRGLLFLQVWQTLDI